MSELALNVQSREQVGKGICRRLRSQGRVPAVVYGKGMTSVPVSLDTKEFVAVLAAGGANNQIINLKGAGLDGQPVIVAEIVRDAMKGLPAHVDLHKINLSDKVKVKVRVTLVGTALGAKEGGLVDFAMHELDVECLATQIPDHLELDVTALTIGHSLHVGDVVAPEGVTILDDPKAAVVSILGRKLTEETEAPAE